MKICTIGFFLLAFLFGHSQTVPVSWKPLGPFNVHQTLGYVEAPGLGVMRSFDVSVKNPSLLIMGGMNVGPQQTLYLPGVWLKKGLNEIIVFEQLNDQVTHTIEGLVQPILEKLNIKK